MNQGLCVACVRSRPHAKPALPNVELCEEHLREQQRDRTGGQYAANTLDDARPFSLHAESDRIQRVERDLHGLDMATALRVLEFVRSRVVGNHGGFK